MTTDKPTTYIAYITTSFTEALEPRYRIEVFRNSDGVLVYSDWQMCLDKLDEDLFGAGYTFSGGFIVGETLTKVGKNRYSFKVFER